MRPSASPAGTSSAASVSGTAPSTAVRAAARASSCAGPLPPGAETSSSDLVDWAHRLADLTGREGPGAKDLVRDLSALQSVMLAELHRALDRIDAVSVLATVERLAELFSELHAAAVEDLF